MTTGSIFEMQVDLNRVVKIFASDEEGLAPHRSRDPPRVGGLTGLVDPLMSQPPFAGGKPIRVSVKRTA